jgi:hypothetical protein
MGICNPEFLSCEKFSTSTFHFSLVIFYPRAAPKLTHEKENDKIN